jgi:uncharacterized protein
MSAWDPDASGAAREVSRRRVLSVLFLGAAALAVLLEPSPLRAESGENVARFVYHVDFPEPRRFSSMLVTIYNQVNHYEDNFIDYDVRIVFMSHGVRFVTGEALSETPFEEDEALAERREELQERLLSLSATYRVQLELCDFTRESAGVQEEALYGGVEIVPLGVVRIGELQANGYAYIKIE